MKFDRKALEHFKEPDRRSALVCSDCVARHRKVEATLRDKRSIRCTCKGKVKERVHVFSNEKCSLFPLYAGEHRWPGKNLDVTFEEYQFCERMRRRQRT